MEAYKILGIVFGGFGLIVVLGILMALPVMLLWNWLMPEIFGLITITFWQALGLSFLAGCLTKGSSSSSSKLIKLIIK